jgi:ornithine--oxo-acid transaminase
MLDNGLLAKQTHEHIIRFAPPLVIADEQLDQALSIIEDSLKSFA